MNKEIKEIEIPFGAKDSELCGWEYTIPEGMEATIVDNKIVVKKESENERIRKILIKFFKKTISVLAFEGISNECVLAWLEKKGEQPSFIDGTFVNVDDVREDFVQEVYRVLDADSTNDRANQIIDAFDNLPTVTVGNQGEQEPADKVEPKFREGEWLCENEPNNYARFIQILEIVNVQGKDRYRISRDIHKDEDVVEFGFVEKYYHKFDIKDAKEGDVLVCPKYAGDIIPNIFIFKDIKIKDNDVFCYCSFLKTFEPGGYIANADPINTDFYPATKEQRELLFQKMKEAGYEWDAEKKELKKCEDNTSEMVGILRTEYEKGRADVIAEMQNAWSEEDEKRIEAIIAFITTENNERGFIGQYGFTAGDLLHFLKSLKERYAWRPSEEQIAALTDAVNYWNKSGCYSSDLVQLLTDLKKLKD